MARHAPATGIGVVGAGYVGLTTAACLAHLGHDVVCMDTDRSKIAQLRAGDVPVREPGLDELVYEGTGVGHQRAGAARLSFTPDIESLAGCGMVVLCLPTPMDDYGDPDTSAVDSVAHQLASLLPANAVLVNKSTVPVGSTHRAERLLGRSDVAAVSNPEFLREGHAVEDFLRPARIVIGASDVEASAIVERMYDGVDAPIVRTDPVSAELAKYACNAFLAVKLSYTNLLSALCEQVGGEIGEVARIMALDDRIGAAFLRPGPGWGGSCLPKDTMALLRTGRRAGLDFGLVRAAIDVNAQQLDRVVRDVRRAVTGEESGRIAGHRIGLLGLTFKAGTADLRDSPALAVAAALAREGAALTGYDPEVPSERQQAVAEVRLVDDPYQVAKGASAVVLLTEWPEFAELDWSVIGAAANNPVVVDTRGVLGHPDTEQPGIERIALGDGMHR
ncbi:MAG: nucleotide sugar dehydrogenase [Actinophytocola sp.]|nr:nucleotide sugar dehydrogenase [Actinophytocola sp.]